MRSIRRLAPVAVLLLAPALAACGGDDESGDPDASTPVERTSDSTDAATPTSSAAASNADDTAAASLPGACDVLTAQDVGDAFGVRFDEASMGSGTFIEQEVEWRTDDCNFEAEDRLEVDFHLTGPDDFTVGGFQCPEPRGIASTVTPVEGIEGADAAWWDEDDSAPLEASLRVCTERYNFDLEIEYDDDAAGTGDPQQQAVGLAEQVIATIGG